MTIQDNLNRIQQAKSDIKAAIESKGVYVDEADKIDIYASKIYEIEQGGGTGVIDIIDGWQLFDMIMNQGYAGPAVLKGTITGIEEISPEYNNATYYVDGTIKVYRGNYFEGMSFVNGDELKIGDYVVVRGTASNYNGTPQIDEYSVIEVLKHEPLIGSLKLTPITTNGEETLYAPDKGLDAWEVVTVRTRVQNPFYTVSQAIEYGATDRPYPLGDYIFVTGRVSEITSINGDRYSFIITDENNTMTIAKSTLVNDISEVQVNDYVVVRGLLDKTGTKIQSSPTLFLKYSNAGGGSCNLGQLHADFEDIDGEGNYWRYGFDDGFDGFNYVKINASAYGEQKRSEGYDQGHSDGRNDGIELGKVYAAEEAIALDITENGTIYTKFAELPEWIEPLTGDDFYSYAYLNGISYNTGYVGDGQSVVEFWFKYDDSISKGMMGTIVGKQGTGGKDILKIRADYTANEAFVIEREGASQMIFTMSKDEWHKIRFSYEGVWVDDVQVASYTEPLVFSDNVPFCINGTTGWQYGANGYFGMVKIDDNVYIPTAEGFINRATGEALDIFTTGTYTFYKVAKPVQYDNLIKQVNVNVNTIIDVAKERLKFSYSTFEKVPDYLDFTYVNDMSYMFSSNTILKDLSNIKDWDTSKVTNMNFMFGGTHCPDFSAIKDWNVSNVIDMSYMFTSNSYIKDFSFMTNWDTSKVTNMTDMLNVSSVTDLPAIDCTSVGYNKYPITLYSNNTKLTNVGGFLNMRSKWDNSYGLSKFLNLTYESCINILNGLYDFTGQTPTTNEAKLKVNQNFLDLVGDEISIGTNKGWTITA